MLRPLVLLQPATMGSALWLQLVLASVATVLPTQVPILTRTWPLISALMMIPGRRRFRQRHAATAAAVARVAAAEKTRSHSHPLRGLPMRHMHGAVAAAVSQVAATGQTRS